MRTLRVVGLVLASAAVAGAQTRVSTSTSTSERTVVRDGMISAAQMNTLLAELAALQARQRALEVQLQQLRDNDANPERIAEVQRALKAAAEQYFPRQSALTLVCQTMIANEARSSGYLGVTLDEEIMVAEPRPGMVEVQVRFAGAPRIVALESGSPAAKAGVRVGDEWVALGDRKLDGATLRDLDALLTPGARQVLRVRRDGREREIDVVVGRRDELPTEACARAAQGFALSPMLELRRTAPTPSVAAVVPPPRVIEGTRVIEGARGGEAAVSRTMTFVTATPTMFGASFRVLDADARDFVGYAGEGLFVDRVAADSPAANAGLRAFDVVTRVNGVVLTSPVALVRAMQEQRRTELVVQRKGTQRTIILTR